MKSDTKKKRLSTSFNEAELDALESLLGSIAQEKQFKPTPEQKDALTNVYSKAVRMRRKFKGLDS